VHFAMGGTTAVTSALQKTDGAPRHQIRLNETVSTIQVADGTARGVECLESGESLTADLVVSNVDPAHLYGRWSKPSQQAASARLKLLRQNFFSGLGRAVFPGPQNLP
jgi:phytoene desaturase